MNNQGQAGNPVQDYIIKTQHIRDVVGLSSVTCRRMEDRGDFPARIKLSQRQHGWLYSDVYKWLEDRRA